MTDAEEQVHEAVAQAAAIDRKGDSGSFLKHRLSVGASPSHIRRFRSRLIAFLENVPEELTVSELLDIVRG